MFRELPRLALLTMCIALLGIEVRAQFPTDDFVENATGSDIWFTLYIVPTNCFGSPGSINDNCVLVQANSSTNITAIPSGSVAARIRIYCTNGCGSYTGLACTSFSTSGSCSGSFTLDGDWTNNIFRVY